ncbi:MAG: heavy metal translocating P-type ATPase [Firmicutes bacterium]|nr:heavy metal translocating P-type ATPase [Bacillota bacterium]
MEQYAVKGMSCAACSARVEKAVSGVKGVTSCSVSLLTNSMRVEGNASADEIINAVRNAGYDASCRGAGNEAGNNSGYSLDQLEDTETPVLKRRLIASIGFLAVLMYFSMGSMMFGWPVPAFFENNCVAMGLLQLILAGIVMVINQKFFINGFSGILHKAPNMDTLVALGSSAAFVYSTVALFAMTGAQVRGDEAAAMSYMHEFYFEAAAMILALITVGKMLEARSKGKTTDALRSLMEMAPKTAAVIRNGEESLIPVEQVIKGDIFVVRSGDSIPVDGIILEGSCAVDESALTGESIPVDKSEGDHVSAATINKSGYIKCEALRVGEDTALSHIIQMVSDAAATKAPIAKAADKVSGVFVPAVIGIALLTIAVWLMLGESIGFALARGISVLVISCPCALGLATPVAIMVGSGKGAKNGILFKTAVSLEQAGRTDIVVLDKTGTITAGTPEVTDILPANGFSEDELLRLAYSLEIKSEHPLGRAVVKTAESRGTGCIELKDFKVLPGNGLEGSFEGEEFAGGNCKFVSEKTKIDKEIEAAGNRLAEEGKTPLYFAKDGILAGIIAVADVIKEDSPQSVKELKEMGIHVVMLTGDNERTAKAIGEQVGVDDIVSDVLPDGKERVIKKFMEKGRVAMVGDGINDAPALTRADIGIAIGAGTDVALDAADIVLMKNTLMDVPAAIRLSRASLRTIHQNLFWAFIYNIIGIPLAAGVFISVLGWQMNPMFGAAAMSLSSFCVVSNALRLNLFDMYDADKFKKNRMEYVNGLIEREEAKMEKTMKIEGMMCMHCEARVKKVLENLDCVEQAVVSHEKGTAVVELKEGADAEVLKKAVEDQDYKVIEIL